MRLATATIALSTIAAASSTHTLDIGIEFATAVVRFDEYRGDNDTIDADEWARFIHAVESPWMRSVAFADVAGANGAIDAEEFAALALFVVAGARDTGVVSRTDFVRAFGTDHEGLFDQMDVGRSGMVKWADWKMYIVPMLIVGNIAGFSANSLATEEQWLSALDRLEAFHGVPLAKAAFPFSAVADKARGVSADRLVVISMFVTVGGADGLLTPDEWSAAGFPDEHFAAVAGGAQAVGIGRFLRYYDFALVAGGKDTITAEDWAAYGSPIDFSSIAPDGTLGLDRWLSLE